MKIFKMDNKLVQLDLPIEATVNNIEEKEKDIICPRRDLGPDNSVRREHLNIWELNLPSFVSNEIDTVELLQRIVNKIEHKFERCEKFLSDNGKDIKLSYYADGYYNGRARAFEEVLDIFKDIIERVYKEQ